MNLNAPETPEGVWQYAAENLRRHKTSGIYYAFIKRGRKQFRRSLKTNDKALNEAVRAECWKLMDLLRMPQNLKNVKASRRVYEARKKQKNTTHTK